jgi:hypothetical protein
MHCNECLSLPHDDLASTITGKTLLVLNSANRPGVLLILFFGLDGKLALFVWDKCIAD